MFMSILLDLEITLPFNTEEDLFIYRNVCVRVCELINPGRQTNTLMKHRAPAPRDICGRALGITEENEEDKVYVYKNKKVTLTLSYSENSK